ncbi:Mitotic spindle checkpoint component mad2 protein [Rutstroemia sp. NJR-2017a BBW]|nr:Mitotic spindle checkpoint component mad2 protein [Rutstroemia sp. NJR-2017a BBW]
MSAEKSKDKAKTHKLSLKDFNVVFTPLRTSLRVSPSSSPALSALPARTNHHTLSAASKNMASQCSVRNFITCPAHFLLRTSYPSPSFLHTPPQKPRKLTPTPQVSSDDQVKAYIKKIMSQLDKWMQRGKISKLIVVITSKETGLDIERWQFDVEILASSKPSKSKSSSSSSKTPSTTTSENAQDAAAAAPAPEKTEAEIQLEIQSIFRQITASVTFLPELNEPCTFNVLVYADADSEVPMEWGDSDAREIVGGEKVQLRSFSTSNHRVGTVVSYRVGE